MEKKEEEILTVTCSFCSKESIMDKKIGKKEVHLCGVCYAAFAMK